MQYLLVLLVATAISLAVIPIMIRLAPALGMLDTLAGSDDSVPLVCAGSNHIPHVAVLAFSRVGDLGCALRLKFGIRCRTTLPTVFGEHEFRESPLHMKIREGRI